MVSKAIKQPKGITPSFYEMKYKEKIQISINVINYGNYYLNISIISRQSGKYVKSRRHKAQVAEI